MAESLAALDWQRAQWATRILFKYCSTFDSTADDKICPMSGALMQALGTDRTVFVGHLFVNDTLLSCFEGTDPKAPLRR